jgi:hypothetical protein
MEQYGSSDPNRKLKLWIEAVEIFEKELPIAKQRVEQDFRQILSGI